MKTYIYHKGSAELDRIVRVRKKRLIWISIVVTATYFLLMAGIISLTN